MVLGYLVLGVVMGLAVGVFPGLGAKDGQPNRAAPVWAPLRRARGEAATLPSAVGSSAVRAGRAERLAQGLRRLGPRGALHAAHWGAVLRLAGRPTGGGQVHWPLGLGILDAFAFISAWYFNMVAILKSKNKWSSFTPNCCESILVKLGFSNV